MGRFTSGTVRTTSCHSLALPRSTKRTEGEKLSRKIQRDGVIVLGSADPLSSVHCRYTILSTILHGEMGP